MEEHKVFGHAVFGKAKKPSLGSKLVMAVFITAVTLVSIATVSAFFANRDQSKVDADTYQAVVLTNTQSYFGKISDINDDYVTLTDVYYLQSGQVSDKENSTEEDKKEPQLQLTRLGGEIHGPQRQMFIAKSNISYWENLRSDSKVVKSIQDYLSKEDSNN